MHRFALLIGAFVVFLCSAWGQAGAKTPAKSALDKAVLEDYVRHLFVWGPHIQVKVAEPKASETLPGFKEVTVVASAGQASQAVTFYVTPDGKYMLQGNVYDVTKTPFQADAAKIKTDLQPSFGTPGAPVVIAVYSDFQCSFCKEEAKVIRQQLAQAEPKEIRVYCKDRPLEQIHPCANAASIAGRCV